MAVGSPAPRRLLTEAHGGLGPFLAEQLERTKQRLPGSCIAAGLFTACSSRLCAACQHLFIRLSLLRRSQTLRLSLSKPSPPGSPASSLPACAVLGTLGTLGADPRALSLPRMLHVPTLCSPGHGAEGTWWAWRGWQRRGRRTRLPQGRGQMAALQALCLKQPPGPPLAGQGLGAQVPAPQRCGAPWCLSGLSARTQRHRLCVCQGAPQRFPAMPEPQLDLWEAR